MAVDAAARDGTRRRKSRREAAAVQRFPREEEEAGERGGLVGRRGLNLTVPGYRDGAWGSILPGQKRLTTPEARRRPGGKWREAKDGVASACGPWLLSLVVQQYNCWYKSTPPLLSVTKIEYRLAVYEKKSPRVTDTWLVLLLFLR